MLKKQCRTSQIDPLFKSDMLNNIFYELKAYSSLLGEEC